MLRLLCLAAVLAAPFVSAQEFPPPGTGTFTWETVTSRPIRALGLAFGPSDSLYAATPDSVFVYEPAPSGPPAGRWRVLGDPRATAEAVLPLDPAGDTLLVGKIGGRFLTRSTDGGRTWVDVRGPNSGGASGGPSHPGGFFVLPPGHTHAGRILAGGYIQYSDDRGATWAEAVRNNAQDFADAHAFALLPSGRVLFGGFYGVAGSNDGGASYTTTPLYGNHIVDGLAALATPGSVQAGVPACGLADPVLCDGAVAVGVDGATFGVYAWRTADGGRSWSSGVSLPQPDDGIGVSLVAGAVALSPGADGLGRAVAVLGRGMVYATRDGGQTWASVGRMPLDADGNHYTRYVLLGPDGHLWVATVRAGNIRTYVYRSAEPAEAAFPVAGEPSPVDRASRLDVRPNPSDGRVSVRLSLDAAASSVTASVYDALGRRVAVLHDGPLAAGPHEFEFEASRLAPGVYVVEVRVSPEAGAAWTDVRRVTIAR